MRLVYAPSDVEWSRLAVIPARGHRRAVDRNRTKRLAREVFRLNKHRMAGPLDIVIVCYPGDYRFVERQEQFLQLLGRERLLRGRLPSPGPDAREF
jgi:ribonuclease P protein component